jgi:hypothetical protein
MLVSAKERLFSARPARSARTDFSRFPTVHRVEPEGRLRVGLVGSPSRRRMTAVCAKPDKSTDWAAGRRGRAALEELGTKANIKCMDDRDRLAFYPFVVVRISCRVCSRSGSYRLARLAAKYGPEITLRDLTERFSYDCLWRAEARSKKGKSA